MMKTFPVLDGLRALSILLVLAGHLVPLGPKNFLLNETVATLGMTIFFSLSGFLIAHYLLNGQRADVFFIRRSARILPLAYLYLLVATVFVHPNVATVFENAFFIENYTYAWLENGHFWSLCVEIHFYLFIGFSVVLLGSRGVMLIPFVCIAVTAMRIWTDTGIDIRTHLRVDEICAGTCVAIATHRGILNDRRAAPIALFCMLLATAISCWPGATWTQFARPYCTGAMLAVALVLQDSFLKDALTSRAARYIAKISYALYVIHLPLAQGVMASGPMWIKYLVKRPISLAATFALAHLSTFHFESWFVGIAKRYR